MLKVKNKSPFVIQTFFFSYLLPLPKQLFILAFIHAEYINFLQQYSHIKIHLQD